ncbi:MAG TPA: sulfite exporter TauE/SafE family protein, partial [Gaiellaceae bacterium]|nr:sulfite exporter TauE/SafE family protein [Gaiellaceae bacterium]
TEPSLVAAVISGAVIGLLGGFVGLILGSLRMPALLRLVGEPASRAVGTNLAVGVCVGIAGLLGHLPSAAPDWRLILVGGAASVPAALLGARLTGRLSERALVQTIGAVLLVAGAGAAIQAFV